MLMGPVGGVCVKVTPFSFNILVLKSWKKIMTCK